MEVIQGKMMMSLKNEQVRENLDLAKNRELAQFSLLHYLDSEVTGVETNKTPCSSQHLLQLLDYRSTDLEGVLGAADFLENLLGD